MSTFSSFATFSADHPVLSLAMSSSTSRVRESEWAPASPNWWVKVSGAERISAAGPPFRDAVPFARKLIAAAPDRTLWGTDWPHPNVRWEPDEADLVDLLPEFGDAAALQRVLVDNPARLYGFA